MVQGAAKEESPDRPTATVEQVFAIAEAIDPQYKALVLVGAFGSLRFGEAAGLRRRSIDILHRTITIDEQAIELSDGSTVFGPPKTAAGRRAVAVPEVVVKALDHHLLTHVPAEPDGLLFTAPRGGPLRRTKFRPRWIKACSQVGVTGLHFHDLRHTGSTLAATSGATIAELMSRLGHKSATAAMRYQHATAARDQSLAAAMGRAIEEATPPPSTAAASVR
jgi:integrase